MEPNGRVRGNRPRAGRFGEGREVWVRLDTWEYVLQRGTTNEDYEHGSLWLRIRKVGQKRETLIPLHLMTVAELDAFAEFMGHVSQRARPICEAYDDEAERAQKEGDDSYARLYRPVPLVVIRERGE